MPRVALLDKPSSAQKSVSAKSAGTMTELDFEQDILAVVAGNLDCMTPAQKGRLTEMIQESCPITDAQHSLNVKNNEENLFRWRQEQLAGAYTAPKVAELLGTTRQTPHDRLKRNALLAIEDNGKKLFPTWQFDPNGDNGVVNGLPEVLKILAVKPPLTVMAWLTEPNVELYGLTPIKALQEGKLEAVMSESKVVVAR